MTTKVRIGDKPTNRTLQLIVYLFANAYLIFDPKFMHYDQCAAKVVKMLMDVTCLNFFEVAHAAFISRHEERSSACRTSPLTMVKLKCLENTLYLH